MAAYFTVLYLTFYFIHAARVLSLCPNGKTPAATNSSLEFCSYKGLVCCDVTEDSTLQSRFNDMSISDPTCASLVKSVLCAKCDPFSGELSNIEPLPVTIPVLCNSSNEFCTNLWDACNDISIRASPFTPLKHHAGVVQNSSSASKLSDLWSSRVDFCRAFGHSGNESVCFNGGVSSSENTSEASVLPGGLCIEKIGNGSYIDMVAHPDGSSRAFLANQIGRIWLASVPDIDSGGTIMLDESEVFLDLSDIVHFDTQFGLMSIAAHPDFVRNGRFFASFNCDKTKSTSCTGRCSCNSDVRCDPAKLDTDYGAAPCQYYSVIAEFTANSSSSAPSLVTRASASESRRIFSMGLPFTGHHGGNIIFGPKDGFLYFMMGDGGSRGDPYNFAQNKKSLLGKIIRLDVDNVPSSQQIRDLDLWGNYTIPADNPFVNDIQWQPEIWALGLRNPWRCSFDLQRPSYFFCADTGQEAYEEVDLISKGGNYGWRIYEGPSLYTPLQTPGGNTTPQSINPIFPVMWYPHSALKTKEGSASIIGGYVYRASTDPCLFGRYLYADLYGEAFWAATEIPENSGNFTSTRVTFSCAQDSPIRCDSVVGSAVPSLGYIYSFGQDNNKDVYLLATTGVYRIVHPSRCNYACSKNTIATKKAPPTNAASSSALCWNEWRGKCLILLFFFFLLCSIF